MMLLDYVWARSPKALSDKGCQMGARWPRLHRAKAFTATATIFNFEN